MTTNGNTGSGQKSQSAVPTKYAKEPRYPGMSTLGHDLNKLPYKRNRKRKVALPQISQPELDQQEEFWNELAEFRASDLAKSLRKPRFRYDYGRDMLTDTQNHASNDLLQGESLNNLPFWVELSLIHDVQRIYKGIVHVERAIDEENTLLLPSPEGNNFGAKLFHLTALHRSLLQEHHDFMLAMQRSGTLERTISVMKSFDIVDYQWEANIRFYLEYVRQNTTDPQKHMLPFIDYVYQKLDSLQENVPLFKDSWDMIARNLHNYLLELHNNSITIPDYYLQYWPSRKPPDSGASNDDGHDMGLSEEEKASNETLPEYSIDLDAPSPIMENPQKEGDLRDVNNVLPLREPVKCFMAGWLTFGSRVATSFCAYCKTFKFLAWAGAAF